MKYSIPYTPGLLDVLRANKEIVGDQISDVYFSDNRFPSNRYFTWVDSNWDELRSIRDEFNCVLHYVVNPSIYDNELYFEEGLLKFINLLIEAWNDGARWLTFNNSILMRLAEFRDNIPPFLIKPSVNAKIATLEQAMFWHDEMYVKDLILDRSLNRNMEELKRISEYAKDNGISITLLANEGCLPNCNWKQHCDNMISQYHKNTVNEVRDLKNIHGMLACTSHYANKPADALKSPFIMPNNVSAYEPYAECIKIAGRMSNVEKLWNILESYFLQTGNTMLFTFFSTQVSQEMSKISFNDLLDLNFDEKTANCKNQCASCNFCERVLDQLMYDKTGVKTNYADQRKVYKPRT